MQDASLALSEPMLDVLPNEKIWNEGNVEVRRGKQEAYKASNH